MNHFLTFAVFASVLVRLFLLCHTALCRGVELGIVVMLLGIGLWKAWRKANDGNDEPSRDEQLRIDS